MVNFNEMQKLHELLTIAEMPHTYEQCWDGHQIRLYVDEEKSREIDDCIYHSGSHGYEEGLLETYHLNDCNGWETAVQVFCGWVTMYTKAKLESKK